MTPSSKKTFVLDTSVLIYDFESVMNFEEHDVAIPITVLEEVDTFKKGSGLTNLHAREVIRFLDKFTATDILDWAPLNGESHGQMRILMDEESTPDANKIFNSVKNDHRILNAVLKLKQNEPHREVVLISKDINLRVKARTLDIHAEDYETTRVKDLEHLYRGRSELFVDDAAIINALYKEGFVHYSMLTEEEPVPNHFFTLRYDQQSALAMYNAKAKRLELAHAMTAYGVRPRNAEQIFALNLLMNPEVQLATITGSAGTGKTLLALASALEQRHLFKQIFLARPVVPLSNKDIGYLPGDINSKLNPYMMPLWDNLSYIKNQYSEGDKQFKKITELVDNDKLHIVPLAYIRGRSLSNVVFIVDEAQNLTPHEVKTIITRAGERTKIIFTGDIYQIDTPYLDAHSNGLTYLVDRMQGQHLYGHINLEKGERSELANVASKVL